MVPAKPCQQIFGPNPSSFLGTLLEIRMDIQGSHPLGRLPRPAARLNFNMLCFHVFPLCFVFGMESSPGESQ